MAAFELCLGRGSHNGIGRLALFVFMQCSYREPQRVPDPVELKRSLLSAEIRSDSWQVLRLLQLEQLPQNRSYSLLRYMYYSIIVY